MLDFNGRWFTDRYGNDLNIQLTFYLPARTLEREAYDKTLARLKELERTLPEERADEQWE